MNANVGTSRLACRSPLTGRRTAPAPTSLMTHSRRPRPRPESRKIAPPSPLILIITPRTHGPATDARDRSRIWRPLRHRHANRAKSHPNESRKYPLPRDCTRPNLRFAIEKRLSKWLFATHRQNSCLVSFTRPPPARGDIVHVRSRSHIVESVEWAPYGTTVELGGTRRVSPANSLLPKSSGNAGISPWAA
jgi:hypothetical protein